MRCSKDRKSTKCNLRLLDVETGFMYKKISFRSVSKPGRMIAPGFVLCGRLIGQTGVGRGSGPTDAATGQMEAGGALGRRPAGFTASTQGRKNPCKFPVVYREPRFALTAGCAWGGRIATWPNEPEGHTERRTGERSASPYEDLGVSCRNTAATSPRRKAGPLAAARLSSAAAIASGGRRLAQNNGPPF